MQDVTLEPSARQQQRVAALFSAGFTFSQRQHVALLVSGSPAGVSGSLLHTLQEHTTFTVAVDAGANETHAAGLAVDLVMGDLDSIDPAAHDQYREQDTPFLTANPHKDETDLELALAELAHRGFTAVVATNVLGGRLDHELAALGALAQARGLRSLVIEDDTALVFLLADKPATSRLRLAHIRNPGDFVSVVPLGGPATVTATGMEWNLHAESLRPLDPRGISNLVRSHEAAIEVGEGAALVVLPPSPEDCPIE